MQRSYVIGGVMAVVFVMPMLFTLEQARALKPLDNVMKYSDAQITAAGELATDALEHACYRTFRLGRFTEFLDGNGREELSISIDLPQSLTAAYVGGVDVLSRAVLYPDGRVYLPGGWTYGRQNVVLTGTAGYAVCPLRVSRAALLLAKRYLVDTPVSDRAVSHTSPDGTSDVFIVAGNRGAVTDVPEANAVIQEYGIAQGLMVS